MKSFLNLAIVVFFVLFTSSFKLTAPEDIKEIFKGTWTSNDLSIKSLGFLDNDMVKVVTSVNGKDVAMHYHYNIYRHVNETYTIKFLKKNLFKEEYELVNSVTAKFNNPEELIIKSNSGIFLSLSKITI